VLHRPVPRIRPSPLTRRGGAIYARPRILPSGLGHLCCRQGARFGPALVIAPRSNAFCVAIRIGGDRAFYSPSTDHIQLPPPYAFRSPEALASVKLHEISHWSGHPSRLDRNLKNKFGSRDYAREELRVEIATIMICSELGLDDCEFTNGASYVADWASTLREDKKEIFRAASDAQRIADYLLAFHPAYAAKHRSARDEADVPAPALAEMAEAA
jgi:antirestriction protein ArdC